MPQINTFRKTLFLLQTALLLALAPQALLAQARGEEQVYLSGTDKDHTVPWDFFCSAGRNSGKWTKIAVPSCWELQGFGGYDYGRAPKTHQFAKEHGLYRHQFEVPKTWADKTVYIVFEGSMTDTEVKINGKSAGPLHQGAFYEFKHDITKLVKPGTNLLEVKVNKISADTSVNRAERLADYWVFGGIFRPVYLKAVPKQHIDHVATNARADGQLAVHVRTMGAASGLQLKAVVSELDGKEIHQFTGAPAKTGPAVLSAQVKNIIPWNPEAPKLYNLTVQLLRGNEVVHEVRHRIGFRTVELRPQDGIYVNGARVVFKGVNRHSFWPSSGRTTSKALSIQDVQVMKDMNMNAVRMSHYPPDRHFLDACDSLGLFVLDELGGWQKAYDTPVGRKLVKELIERDVNHPSIVLWDNGNEGGHNHELVPEFAKHDPQKRHVIHPWAVFNNTDTQHYKPYGYGTTSLFNGRDIFFPTEFMHGLFDGGGGAGLDDQWQLMRQNPLSAGGFIWAFCDECVVRTDRHDSLDCKISDAPDGIVGPYREKEGSFYAIKQIWSPVLIRQKVLQSGPARFLEITNDYLFTNLNQINLNFSWLKMPRLNDAASVQASVVHQWSPTATAKPGETVRLDLPANAPWAGADVLQLEVVDNHGRLANTLTWNISTAAEFNAALRPTAKAASPAISQADSTLTVRAGAMVYAFNKNNGRLVSVVKNGKKLGLANGPQLAVGDVGTLSFEQVTEANGSLKLKFAGKKELVHLYWTVAANGQLTMDCSYKYQGAADHFGLNFDYPEKQVKSIRWLGNGPFRVWKNRLQGPVFGVHSKTYNTTRTGWEWVYPEFAGYHSNFYWAQLETSEGSLKLVTESPDLFLRLLTPHFATKYWNEQNTQVKFPSGNLGFMHAIDPIGEKFTSAAELGPSGNKNLLHSNRQHPVHLNAVVHFMFE